MFPKSKLPYLLPLHLLLPTFSSALKPPNNQPQNDVTTNIGQSENVVGQSNHIFCAQAKSWLAHFDITIQEINQSDKDFHKYQIVQSSQSSKAEEPQYVLRKSDFEHPIDPKNYKQIWLDVKRVFFELEEPKYHRFLAPRCRRSLAKILLVFFTKHSWDYSYGQGFHEFAAELLRIFGEMNEGAVLLLLEKMFAKASFIPGIYTKSPGLMYVNEEAMFTLSDEISKEASNGLSLNDLFSEELANDNLCKNVHRRKYSQAIFSTYGTLENGAVCTKNEAATRVLLDALVMSDFELFPYLLAAIPKVFEDVIRSAQTNEDYDEMDYLFNLQQNVQPYFDQARAVSVVQYAQGWFLKKSAQEWSQKRHAAKRIQGGMQGMLARRSVDQQLKEKQEEENLNNAATRIQSGARRLFAKRSVDEQLKQKQQEQTQNNAVTRIQSGVRGLLAKTNVNQRLQEQQQQQSTAATTIQSVLKSKLASDAYISEQIDLEKQKVRDSELSGQEKQDAHLKFLMYKKMYKLRQQRELQQINQISDSALKLFKSQEADYKAIRQVIREFYGWSKHPEILREIAYVVFPYPNHFFDEHEINFEKLADGIDKKEPFESTERFIQVYGTEPVKMDSQERGLMSALAARASEIYEENIRDFIALSQVENSNSEVIEPTSSEEICKHDLALTAAHKTLYEFKDRFFTLGFEVDFENEKLNTPTKDGIHLWNREVLDAENGAISFDRIISEMFPESVFDEEEVASTMKFQELIRLAIANREQIQQKRDTFNRETTIPTRYQQSIQRQTEREEALVAVGATEDDFLDQEEARAATSTKLNVVFVGPQGAGKSTILQGFKHGAQVGQESPPSTDESTHVWEYNDIKMHESHQATYDLRVTELTNPPRNNHDLFNEDEQSISALQQASVIVIVAEDDSGVFYSFREGVTPISFPFKYDTHWKAVQFKESIERYAKEGCHFLFLFNRKYGVANVNMGFERVRMYDLARDQFDIDQKGIRMDAFQGNFLNEAFNTIFEAAVEDHKQEQLQLQSSGGLRGCVVGAGSKFGCWN